MASQWAMVTALANSTPGSAALGMARCICKPVAATGNQVSSAADVNSMSIPTT
jgi:hypothetical protein